MHQRTQHILLAGLFLVVTTTGLQLIHPSLELTLSISIRLLTCTIAVILAMRYREGKLLFLALLFFLMASRQILTLLIDADIINESNFHKTISELPGFIVTLLALASIIYIAVLLARLKGNKEKIDIFEEILPVCLKCKKIRYDEHTWVELENYLSMQQNTQVSHGLCDDCLEREIKKLESNSEE